MKTKVEIQTITPEIASEWLSDRFADQRHVRKTHVERLASDMSNGRFKLSPDAIVRIRGILGNGQHRLEAVVLCGKSMPFLVMESNDEDLYKIIDSGIKRTAQDSLIGITHAKHMPSISRWVMAYEKGVLRISKIISQTEIIEYCISNRDALSLAAQYVYPLYEQTKLLPVSVSGALHVISRICNKSDLGDQFLQKVYVHGGSDSAGDLRNRMISNKGSRSKLEGGYVFAISLKAFKSFCNGTRPGVLKWVEGEPLPTI